MAAARAETRISKILATGGTAIGTWLSLASTGSAETLSQSGLDWLLIDQQHTAIGPAETLDLIRAVNCGDASPVVRVPVNAPGAFDQALDSGAHAIMVPNIETADAAKQAVALATFPPAGARSIGGYRAQYSFDISRADYLRAQPALLILQIEHIRAVERIEEITRVTGVGAFFVGPQDLSASMGLAPSLVPDDRGFEDAVRRVRDACAAAKVPLGILVPDATSAKQRIAQGFRLIAVGTDAAMLLDRGKALGQELR